MHFGTPSFFWALLALPLLVGFFIWAHQRRQAALQRFAELPLMRRLTPSVSRSRQILRWVLFLVFFFFLVLALVRPRFGVKTEMIERKGVDIIVALDVSQSMLANDIVPSRLERAKREVARFIDLIKGDRVGLIIFAGESYNLCPLTLDYGAARLYLDQVATDWIQLQGTAISEAISQAQKAFAANKHKDNVLILLSDGEELEGDPLNAAKAAREAGIRIYTVGLGSESGVPIPVQSGGGNVVYKKDASGNLVMTKLNAVMLERIAIEGGGKYFHAGTNLNLSEIYQEIEKLEKRDFGSNRVAVYEEQYQIFLCLALILLLIEFFVPERVTPKEEWRGRFSGN